MLATGNASKQEKRPPSGSAFERGRRKRSTTYTSRTKLRKPESPTDESGTAEPGSWASLVKSRPGSVSLWLKYAESEAQKRGPEAGREVLEQALQSRDLYRQEALWRALATKYQTCYEAALKKIRQAIQLLPRSASLWELYTELRYFPSEVLVRCPLDECSDADDRTQVPLFVHFEQEWLTALQETHASLEEKEHVYLIWAATLRQLQNTQASSCSRAENLETAARDISEKTIDAVAQASSGETIAHAVLLRGARCLRSARLWKYFLESAVSLSGNDDLALLEEAMCSVPPLRNDSWFCDVLRARRERWALERDTRTLASHVERFPTDPEAWLMFAEHYRSVYADETQAEAILLTFLQYGFSQAPGNSVARFIATLLDQSWSRTRSLARVRAFQESALACASDRAARDAIFRESLRFERYKAVCLERCRELFRRWLAEAPHLASVWASWAQLEREVAKVPANAVLVLQVAVDLFHEAFELHPSGDAMCRQRQMLQILALWRSLIDSRLAECSDPQQQQDALRSAYRVLLNRYSNSLAVVCSYAALEAFTGEGGLDSALEFLRQRRLEEHWPPEDQLRLTEFVAALRRTHAAVSRRIRARLWQDIRDPSD